ncbi:MAG: hypothetical protein AAFZ89_07315, partial [Bacteroidota bacterium]
NNTNDILFTKNGEIIQGKVVKVTSSTINFSYPGETLINEIGVQNLEKIVFSSGRTQLFGNTSSGNNDITATKAVVPVPNSPASQPIPKEEIYLGPDSYENNRLAVVPLSFTKNDTYDKDVSSQMTQFVTGYLLQKNQSLPIEVQDMKTTIKKLVDSGVGFQQLSQTPIDRLQQILGSEYIVVVEVGESSAKGQKKASSGFFDSAQVASSTESGIRYDIELIIYGGQASEKYSAKFSDERSFKSPIANADQEGWKKAMQYVLDQVLSSGNL